MEHTSKILVTRENLSDEECTKFVDGFGTYTYSHYLKSAGRNPMKARQWSDTIKYILGIKVAERNDGYRMLVINSQEAGSKIHNGAKEEHLNPANDTKDTNPKDGIGATKLPLSLVPPVAMAHAALAHLDGACKYGKWNWRIAGVRASIYIDAALRHITAYNEGEEVAADSKVHHLGHAIACLNILLDAASVGKLIDDRPPSGYIPPTMATLVEQIKKNHADKSPRHYSIENTDHGLDRNPTTPTKVSAETPVLYS